MCIIGGASRGIGQGIAVRFGRAGAKVCVLGRSDGKIVTGPGTLSNVVAQITSIGGNGAALLLAHPALCRFLQHYTIIDTAC